MNSPVKPLQPKIHLVAHPVGLSGLPDGLPALCSSRQCRPPPLARASPCGGAQAHPARPNAVGGCSGASASSHLDDATFANNTSRSSRWPTCHRTFPLPLAHRVRCARITAGVGKIGSRAMLGGDHPGSVSRPIRPADEIYNAKL